VHGAICCCPCTVSSAGAVHMMQSIYTTVVCHAFIYLDKLIRETARRTGQRAGRMSRTQRPVRHHCSNIQIIINCIIASITLTKQKYRHCDKKLARLLFDFHIIPQLLSTQRTMSVNNRLRRSHSIDSTCGPTYFSTSETRIYPQGGRGVWRGSECGNRISGANFSIVFHS